MSRRNDCWISRATGSLALVMIVAGGCSGASEQSRTADDEEYYQAPSDQGSRGGAQTDPTDGAPEPEPEPEVPAVLVRRGPASSGSLDGDVVGQAVFGIADELTECYSAAGGASLGRGVMYVLIDVEGDGSVGGVLIGHSDVRDIELRNCVNERLGALSLPTSEGVSVVQTHLVFGARDQDEGRAMLRAYRAARAEAAREADVPVPLTAVRESVEGCFERVFRGRGTEGGRLVLQLTVDGEGRVTEVEITEDEGTEGRLDSCVEDVVGKLRLDVEEASTISYPVILQPARAAEPEPDGAPAPPAAPEEPAAEE